MITIKAARENAFQKSVNITQKPGEIKKKNTKSQHFVHHHQYFVASDVSEIKLAFNIDNGKLKNTNQCVIFLFLALKLTAYFEKYITNVTLKF